MHSAKYFFIAKVLFGGQCTQVFNNSHNYVLLILRIFFFPHTRAPTLLIINYENENCRGFDVGPFLAEAFFPLNFDSILIAKNANAMERLPFLQPSLRPIQPVFLRRTSPFSLPDIPAEDSDIFLLINQFYEIEPPTHMGTPGPVYPVTFHHF
jgi:hypothetical protein